jgi:hypothetical protein
VGVPFARSGPGAINNRQRVLAPGFGEMCSAFGD